MRTSNLASLLLGAATLFATQAHAEGWVIGPAFEEGWKPEFTVAAMGGVLTPNNGDLDTAAYKGIEVSLNCPWFQPPQGTIRQQFWIGRYKDSGVKLTSYEVNPRWFNELGNGWSLGVGPGFGYIEADAGGDETGMWSLQLGGDLHYRSGPLFFGIGARYQFTDDKEIYPGEDGADNWVAVAKIGINF